MFSSAAMTIKKQIKTKYILPALNWTVMRPNQVKGTIFNELDEEKLYQVIDFGEFEEQFKVGVREDSNNGTLVSMGSKRFKPAETPTLLDSNRHRDIGNSQIKQRTSWAGSGYIMHSIIFFPMKTGIFLAKLKMPVEVVIKAVNALDLDALPLNKVDILQKMVPNEQEVRRSSKTALFIKIFGYLNANPDHP
jgi:formic-like protein